MKSKSLAGAVIWASLMLWALPGAAASSRVVDRVIAVVNTDIITQVDLDEEARPFLKDLEFVGYTDEEYELMKQQAHTKILGTLIERTLIQQEARKANITVTEEQIDAAVDQVKEKNRMTRQDFEEMLMQKGITLPSYRDIIRKQLLQSGLISRIIQPRVVITEEEIKAYYEDHKADYAGEKRYRLKYISSDNEADVKEAYEQLKEGVDFKWLAGRYSTASNSADGGKLGLFNIDHFSKNVRQEIEPLEKGTFTPVIQNDGDYQIFYLEDIVSEGARSLAQARDDIYNRLYRPKAQQEFSKWLSDLKKQAYIQIKNSDIK